MPYVVYFVDVVLPLALPRLYTYRVPQELNEQIEIGKRVVVQFGKNKLYSALIYKIHQNPPIEYEAKYIISVVDEKPIVSPVQLKLWEWIANYYMCTLGEVMNAALPAGLKLSSETKICTNPDFTPDILENSSFLTDKEYLVMEALSIKKYLTFDEVSKLLEIRNILPVIKSLLSKDLIYIEEEIKEKYKPLITYTIRLNPDFSSEEGINQAFDMLSKAPKQEKLLEHLIDYLIKEKKPLTEPIERSILLKKASSNVAVLNALIEKKILIQEKHEINRIKYDIEVKNELPILSASQNKALEEIKSLFNEYNTVLLHGVTSSGKTEIYIHLINEYLNNGYQVLYILPEIAITTQLIQRLNKFFGNKIGIYHSKYSDNERVEVWNRLLLPLDHKDNIKIVVGVRSAVFLPFSRLGLVIVDEEHENTFKQQDPSPRYHARDTAIYLAYLWKVKTLLGTATPSIETYYNCQIKKYGLVELTERYGNVNMPEIKVVDVKKFQKSGQMKSIFSIVLLEEIQKTLSKKEQIILFQNRRGYSPYIECSTCAYVIYCKNCNVALTYHKTQMRLICHYCGYSLSLPESCPACKSPDLKTIGFGTEKIEEELKIFFPQATIRRLDLDTTRSRKSYQEILGDFESRKTDILVGTQMITKGLDFDNVGLVGVLLADNLFNYPDFRSYERSFQLLEQVSGRAGRKKSTGKVIIQTRKPEHPVIIDVVNHNYQKMFNKILKERYKYRYPPFYKLIKLTLKHKSFEEVEKKSILLAEELKKMLGELVLGPVNPVIQKINNLYLKDILIKLKNDVEITKTKKEIEALLNGFRSRNKNILVKIDVDPQ